MRRTLNDDMKLSNDIGMKLFLKKYGQLLDITNCELITGERDWKLCQDALLTFKNQQKKYVSFRFRLAKTAQGKDIYTLHDITLRFERPSGTKSDLSKMKVDWFLYGVLSKDKLRFSRITIIDWANRFETYIQAHPEILSTPISNIDKSSTFKTVKLADIPSEFILFHYDNNRGLYRGQLL